MTKLETSKIIEAQIPIAQYYEQGFAAGDKVLLTVKKARVFVAPA